MFSLRNKKNSEGLLMSTQNMFSLRNNKNSEGLLMSTHNICLYQEISKIPLG